MFAEASHPLSIPASSRLRALVSRVFHAFDSEPAAQLPAELQRLPDHLLLDLGVEPHRVRPSTTASAIRPELIRREWP